MEALGLDFEGFWEDFRGSGPSILARFVAVRNVRPRSLEVDERRWLPAGGFNGIGAKLIILVSKTRGGAHFGLS